MTQEDKEKYLNNRLEKVIRKYNEKYDEKISEKDVEEIKEKINVNRYLNIRYLNRAIKDEILIKIKMKK